MTVVDQMIASAIRAALRYAFSCWVGEDPEEIERDRAQFIFDYYERDVTFEDKDGDRLYYLYDELIMVVVGSPVVLYIEDDNGDKIPQGCDLCILQPLDEFDAYEEDEDDAVELVYDSEDD